MIIIDGLSLFRSFPIPSHLSTSRLPTPAFPTPAVPPKFKKASPPSTFHFHRLASRQYSNGFLGFSFHINFFRLLSTSSLSVAVSGQWWWSVSCQCSIPQTWNFPLPSPTSCFNYFFPIALGIRKPSIVLPTPLDVDLRVVGWTV